MEIYQFFHKNLRITNDNLIKNLEKKSSLEMIKRKSLLFQKDEFQKEIYFLFNGFFRTFYYDENGREITEYFECESGQMLVTNSVIENESVFYIQAIIDSVVLKIENDSFLDFMKEYPEFSKIYNNVLIESLKKHWKLKEIRCRLNAEKRYEWFLSEYAILNKYVKDKDIASFLGMNPVTLSKIKNSKNFIK